MPQSPPLPPAPTGFINSSSFHLPCQTPRTVMERPPVLLTALQVRTAVAISTGGTKPRGGRGTSRGGIWTRICVQGGLPSSHPPGLAFCTGEAGTSLPRSNANCHTLASQGMPPGTAGPHGKFCVPGLFLGRLCAKENASDMESRMWGRS